MTFGLTVFSWANQKVFFFTGHRENEVLEEESTYLITIGFLVFTCVGLLIVSIILTCQLYRKKKATSIASRDSTSFTIRINDCPDGDWD